MADRLLELLQKRQTSGTAASLQTPKYLDAMVLSKGTVANIGEFRPVESIPGPTSQVYNVAVLGTTIIPKSTFGGSPDRYVFIDYLDDDYLDPEFLIL